MVGGGPAGLACAHRLALLGHEVIIYEAREKLSGLNEYGIAAYKTVDGFAQREVDFILGIGGIETRCNVSLGKDLSLSKLREEFDAVFLGIGLKESNEMEVNLLPEEGVYNAIDYIEKLRQVENLSHLPVGRLRSFPRLTLQRVSIPPMPRMKSTSRWANPSTVL